MYRKIQPVLVFCQLAVVKLFLALAMPREMLTSVNCVIFTVCLNEKNVRSLNHLHCIKSIGK